MLPKLRLAVVLCVILFPLAAHLRSESPLTISAAFVDPREEGPMTRGTLRFTLVNGGDQALAGVRLTLAYPRVAWVRPQAIEVGAIAAGGTAIGSAEALLETRFWASSDPLIVEVTYTRSDGAAGKDRVVVIREGGAR